MSNESNQETGELQQDVQETPFSDNGEDTDRDRSGRFVRGNTAALVSGAHSKAFWSRVEDARRDLIARVLDARGVSLADATPPLMAAADGLAKAVLLRSSEWDRVRETGGQRAAVQAWEAADARVERWVRILGLERSSKRIDLARSMSGLD